MYSSQEIGLRPQFCTFLEKNVFEWILCSKFVTSISDDIEKMHFTWTFLGLIKINFAIKLCSYFKEIHKKPVRAIKIFGFYWQKTQCAVQLCLVIVCPTKRKGKQRPKFLVRIPLQPFSIAISKIFEKLLCSFQKLLC